MRAFGLAALRGKARRHAPATPAEVLAAKVAHRDAVLALSRVTRETVAAQRGQA